MITRRAALLAALALAGCASDLPRSVPLSHLKCEDVASDATAFGRAAARSVALAGLSHEVPDAKGFLVSSGVRRVRVVSRRVDCRPSPLVPQLTKCTAHARLCGR